MFFCLGINISVAASLIFPISFRVAKVRWQGGVSFCTVSLNCQKDVDLTKILNDFPDSEDSSPQIRLRIQRESGESGKSFKILVLKSRNH